MRLSWEMFTKNRVGKFVVNEHKREKLVTIPKIKRMKMGEVTYIRKGITIIEGVEHVMNLFLFLCTI